MKRSVLAATCVLALGVFAADDAHAQKLPPPNRPGGWDTLSTVAMTVGLVVSAVAAVVNVQT